MQRAYHIYPADDIQHHVLHCDYPQSRDGNPGRPRCLCPCQPTTQELEDGSIIIQHNSFDATEALEWFTDVLNEKPAFTP